MSPPTRKGTPPAHNITTVISDLFPGASGRFGGWKLRATIRTAARRRSHREGTNAPPLPGRGGRKGRCRGGCKAVCAAGLLLLLLFPRSTAGASSSSSSRKLSMAPRAAGLRAHLAVRRAGGAADPNAGAQPGPGGSGRAGPGRPSPPLPAALPARAGPGDPGRSRVPGGAGRGRSRACALRGGRCGRHEGKAGRCPAASPCLRVAWENEGCRPRVELGG